MRDITETKFQRAAEHMGFDTTPQMTLEGLRFVRADGLRVEPVLHAGTVRVHRRESLARMARVGRQRPQQSAKSEATGADTPMASM